MKALIMTLLLAAVATALPTTASLNSTDVCYGVGVFNRSLLETNTSGWAYNATGCTIADNSYVNISGKALPLNILNGPNYPVGFVFNGGVVGAGSALVIQGPSSNFARMTLGWLIDIIGNTFQQDAQLRVIGSIPINSSITISQNTFDVRNPNAFLTDSLDTIYAITLGGNLTTAYEPMSIYLESGINITENVISVNGETADTTAAGIGFLSDIYFTNVTAIKVTDNVVTATCGINAGCTGLDTQYFLVMQEGFKDSYTLIERNTFTIQNGRGFALPQVYAPNNTFYLSGSYNRIDIVLQSGSAANVYEHAITFNTTVAARSTSIQVVYNNITTSGNSMFFFVGAVDFSEYSVFNCSRNSLLTTGGDPGVYFLDTLSFIDYATFTISNNRFKRLDNVAVTRTYITITYDFNVLGYAEFSFRNNEFYPTNSAQGPLMVVLSTGRVANVGPTAYFAVCGNIYNGNPADLLVNQVLSTNIRGLINCNARQFPTTVAPTNAPTSLAPTTSAFVNQTVTEPLDNSAKASAVSVIAAVLVAVVAMIVA